MEGFVPWKGEAKRGARPSQGRIEECEGDHRGTLLGRRCAQLGVVWDSLSDVILDTVVLAIVLGIASQVVAERFRIPAILPLLSVGILAGPGFLGLIHPDHLGEGLEVLVHLGVAVILFEGGLSLDLGQLSRVGVAVRNEANAEREADTVSS
jgi:hypothetical protein